MEEKDAVFGSCETLAPVIENNHQKSKSEVFDSHKVKNKMKKEDDSKKKPEKKEKEVLPSSSEPIIIIQPKTRPIINTPFAKLAPIVIRDDVELEDLMIERESCGGGGGGPEDRMVEELKEEDEKGEEEEEEAKDEVVERTNEDNKNEKEEEEVISFPARSRSEDDFDEQFSVFDIERVHAPVEGEALTNTCSTPYRSSSSMVSTTGRSPREPPGVFDLGSSIPAGGGIFNMTGSSAPGFWTNTLSNILAASVPSHSRYFSGVTASSAISGDANQQNLGFDLSLTSPSAKAFPFLQPFSHPVPKTPHVTQSDSLATSAGGYGVLGGGTHQRARGGGSRTYLATPPSGSLINADGINTPVVQSGQYDDGGGHEYISSPYGSYQGKPPKGSSSSQTKKPLSNPVVSTFQSEFSRILAHVIPTVSAGSGNSPHFTPTPSIPPHISLSVNFSSFRKSLAEGLNPNDFLPFTRKPLFVIVDSDAAGSFGPNSPFSHFNSAVRTRSHGQPIVILMSPTQPRYIPCGLFHSLTARTAADTPVLVDRVVSPSIAIAGRAIYPPHLIPLLPHHSSIGRLYTLALTDPISTMLLIAHPARCYRATLLRARSLPGSSYYPIHPSSIPVRASLKGSAQKYISKKLNSTSCLCSCFTLVPCCHECPCLTPPPSLVNSPTPTSPISSTKNKNQHQIVQ
jgi:hypothetical protein